MTLLYTIYIHIVNILVIGNRGINNVIKSTPIYIIYIYLTGDTIHIILHRHQFFSVYRSILFTGVLFGCPCGDFKKLRI